MSTAWTSQERRLQAAINMAMTQRDEAERIHNDLLARARALKSRSDAAAGREGTETVTTTAIVELEWRLVDRASGVALATGSVTSDDADVVTVAAGAADDEAADPASEARAAALLGRVLDKAAGDLARGALRVLQAAPPPAKVLEARADGLARHGG